LPNLIERTGTNVAATGTITSIYTVLADGDDMNTDPIVDTARAILDGHIVLSREFAQQGVYPAIDVTRSISRLMSDIVDKKVLENAKKLRKLISKYQENEDLIMMGGYAQGQDPDLDMAITNWPSILEFLKQDYSEAVSFTEAQKSISELVGHIQ
jgi:flagellum-specific ATP synthase